MKQISACIISMLALLFSGNIFAQNVSIGARGGISIPNLTAGGSETNPLNTGYKSRLGGDAAIFAAFRLTPVFSIQPMIEYSSQGGKKEGMQAFPTPQEYASMFPQGAPEYLYADFKSEAKLNYLLVPVLAKFGWNIQNSPLRIYVDAGPFAGFLLSAHQVLNGSSIIYADPKGQQPLSPEPQPFDSTKNIKSDLNTFNFGVSGNIGIAYRFNKSSIFLEGGGNYGFLNIQKGNANGKNHTGAGTVDVGYTYRFGR
ncbi:MAG: porin family protein [Ginsengibacter sp.]